MTDLTKVKLVNIGEWDFWPIIDEMCDDNSAFLFNRRTLLNAYTNGTLYGLKVEDSDDSEEKYLDPIFCRDSFYLLPCFCIAEKNCCHILWVHSRARKQGLGSKLVKLLDIHTAIYPLDDTLEFWKKCGVNPQY